MKYFLSLLLALTAATSIIAQVMPPVQPVIPKTPAVKFKAMAPPTVKAGEHIIVDASSAKGKIEFLFDPIAFPKSRATLIGKTLILSTPINGTYTVSVVSYEDGVTEKIDVKVTGGEPNPNPQPSPPMPTDPLELLKVEMRNGFAKFDKFDARLTLLEQIKPVPPPPPGPPDPQPSPKALKLYLLVFFDKLETSTPVIVGDIDFWDTFKARGHGWRKIDVKNPEASPWKNYYTTGGVSPPSLVVIDAANWKWLATYAMTNDKAAIEKIVNTHTGK